MKEMLRVTMPDGSRWDVPVDIIARHRAAHYAADYDGDVGRSLREDTRPLFASDDDEIEDWASNNMSWQEDVETHATEVEPATLCLYEEGWVNGEMEVVVAA